jgi:polar amino acid transport system substrate-binding protein
MAALPNRLLPVLLLMPCLAHASQPDKIIDLECDYLPNVCNQPGEPTPGMMIEIGSEAIRRAGFIPRTKIRPWNRAMREVIDRPNAVIIYFARTPEREALFRWIAVTNTTDFKFFTKDGTAPYHTVQQAAAAGLIGVRSGSSIISWLTQQGITQRQLEQSQLAEMAKMLKAGRIASFLGASITFKTIYLQQTGALPVEGDVVYSSQSWLASGPRFPAEHAAKIAAALSRMKQDGIVEQLMRKYGR